MKKFNINSNIYIQITSQGWEHLVKTVGMDHIKHSILPRQVFVTNDVWFKLQCHEVFRLFPTDPSTGDLLFKTTILLNEESLDNFDT